MHNYDTFIVNAWGQAVTQYVYNRILLGQLVNVWALHMWWFQDLGRKAVVHTAGTRSKS